MFHGSLMHGPAPNITPYPRKIVYFALLQYARRHRRTTAE